MRMSDWLVDRRKVGDLQHGKWNETMTALNTAFKVLRTCPSAVVGPEELG